MAESCQPDGGEDASQLGRSQPTYETTDEITDKKITTTTTTSTCGGRDLIFPEKLEPEELELIRDAIGGCPEEQRQNVLDELAGAMRDGAVRSPVGFFTTLVRAAVAGTFTLQRGAGVRARRRREAERRDRERGYSDPQPLPATRATHPVRGPRAVSARQRLREAIGGGANGKS
jgi:hypothetical protein